MEVTRRQAPAQKENRRMALWVSRAVPRYKCCPATQWVTSGAKQGVWGIIQNRHKRMWQKEQGLRRQSCVHMKPVSTTSSSGRCGMMRNGPPEGWDQKPEGTAAQRPDGRAHAAPPPAWAPPGWVFPKAQSPGLTFPGALASLRTVA